ncbi:MAG: hypothetical protein JXR78_09410 [Victivallales bacterium]|nr:hypothetical protein [Victivallales bacterium]
MEFNLLNNAKLHEALNLLNEQLLLQDAPFTGLVVCGGSALIATGLITRTTRDVDILALMHDSKLKESEPLPEYLLHAANQVRRILDLPQSWLNNGPAAQFQMGLPDGFTERLHKVIVGEKLEMYYIDRRDQIFFKTYASADRGGYHVTDLLALNPAEDELVDAARWCMAQDVSLEFHQIIKDMFRKLGVKSVSDRI